MSTPSTTRVRPLVQHAWFDPMLAALVAFAMSLPVVGYPLLYLGVPWGAGDLAAHYMNASAWSPFGVSGDVHFGFPDGIDLAYIPTIDHTQNAFAWIVTAISGNSFAGLNLLLVASFPLTAALTVTCLRLVSAQGYLAIALAVAYTFIPYHFDRGLSHLYPATMYAGVTGILLALWIGTGQRATRRWHAPAIVLLILVTAWSGMYYAAFGIALTLTAVAWRWIRSDTGGHVARALLIPAAIAAATLLAFLPGIVRLLTRPPLINLVERSPAESVTFAGNLAQLLTPYISRDIPVLSAFTNTLAESQEILGSAAESRVSGFGTFITTAALIVFLVGWAVRARRRLNTEPLGLIAMLILTSSLLFIPWGGGYLIAGYITPQLRAWNRLTPLLLLLLIVGAAAVLATTRWMDRPRSIIASVVIVVLVFASNVLPFRTMYASAVDNGRYLNVQLAEYRTQLNAAIPTQCGVLQLPYMAFPENGIREPGLNDYEHAWQPLTNPGKLFSYGAVKGTQASVLAASLTDPPSRRQLDELRSRGFCTIHLDKRGYTEVAWQRVILMLGADLGPPVAEGLDGAWVAFRL